jgi:hypothetical protein
MHQLMKNLALPFFFLPLVVACGSSTSAGELARSSDASVVLAFSVLLDGSVVRDRQSPRA